MGCEFAEDLRNIIRDIEQQAIKDGKPQIVKLCQVKSDVLGIREAREIIATCIAIDKPNGQYLIPSEAASILRVSENKILTWIREGRLPATNVNDTGRPSYRIRPDDIKNISTPEPDKPKRRKQSSGKDYFPDK